MALAEAEYLRRSYDLLISVPDGPLRPRFAVHGKLTDSTASMPLWGDSPWCWVGRCVRTVPQAIRLARLIRRNEVDLVLTNSSVSLAPVLAGRLARVPVLIHVRDVPGSRLAPLVFKLEAALAQTVIVITDGLIRYFRALHGARVVRIPDGIELTGADLGTDGLVPPTTKLGDPLRLCVVGGVHPRKGQDIAVEALATLRGNGIAAVLDLVGREVDPVFSADLRDRTEQLNVADYVSFVGELSDVRPHLRQIDIVLAPSRDEWTPLALMEAMALEKPVVAAKVGGVPDVIADRETGLLVPPEDPHSLARAISEVVADPTAAAHMASRARRSVNASFAISKTLAALESEIRRVVPTSD